MFCLSLRWNSATTPQKSGKDRLDFFNKLIKTLPANGEIERTVACFGVPLFELFESEERVSSGITTTSSQQRCCLFILSIL